MPTPVTALTQTELTAAIIRNPLMVNADSTVMDAIAKMNDIRMKCADDNTGDRLNNEVRASCVLVIQEKRLLGMITERDIVSIIAQQRSLDTVTVQAVMTTPVVTLREADFTDLFTAVELLQKTHIRHLVILDRDDCILGIVTHESLLQLARPTDFLLEQCELELNQSEQRFISLTAAAPVGIFRTDPDGRCLYVNDRWCQMAGLTAAEAADFGWVNGIYSGDRELVKAEWNESARNIRPFSLEYRFQNKSGQITWVLGRAVAEHSKTGELIGYVGTITDISDRIQAEAKLQQLNQELEVKVEQRTAALKASEATNRATLEAIPDLLLRLRRDGTCVQYIKAGIQADSFLPITNHISEVLPPDLLQNQLQIIDRAITTGELQVYEHQFLKSDRMVHEEIRIVAINEQEVLVIVRDISSRKQAELKVHQTTAQLEASNRELEAFAYSVSHDLRAPLRAIDCFSVALIEDYGEQFGAEGKDYFDRIRSNIRRMGMLIDGLLRLSRISRSEMQYSHVNLSALVQEQVSELQILEPERQVEVIICPDIFVSADATLIRVVISNLVQNAWKFTSHHATARIEFGVVPQEGQLTYFVGDDGAGFDMNYANMLFRVFQRLHDTNEFEGTGIGLASVQRAIYRHGGQVWAEGVVEQGVTVYFTLPHLSA